MSLGTIITSSFYVQCLFWSDRNLFLRINMDSHRERNIAIIQYQHYYCRRSLSWPLDYNFKKGIFLFFSQNVYTTLISFSIYKDGVYLYNRNRWFYSFSYKNYFWRMLLRPFYHVFEGVHVVYESSLVSSHMACVSVGPHVKNQTFILRINVVYNKGYIIRPTMILTEFETQFLRPWGYLMWWVRVGKLVWLHVNVSAIPRVLKEKAYNGRIKQKLEFLEGVSGFLI